MKQYYHATELRFEGNVMILTIDGQDKRFQVSEISPDLQHASEQERNLFEISPSGYGIHWLLLDENLSIDGLLGVVHEPQKTTKSAYQHTAADGRDNGGADVVGTDVGGGFAARR
jgi:hypothetical protein